MRDNWWHLVAFTPIGVLLGGLIGGYIGGLLVIGSVLPYPLAIRWDAKYANQQATEAVANVNLVTVLGVLVLVTLGFLSFVASPYYLYKRRKHLS